ncbi:MAG: GNAT family N-acetyltransferase, partial [Tidjanibacter sp.]|nr:GNAT family N-acetyltransferase [Tidjanibacter sp.]
MITVKKADLSHLDVLCEFQQAMALESEGMALDNATLRAGINALLTDRNKGQYYIAEQEGRVVGCLMITLEWSDWRNGWVWWIQSVFVAQNMRRKGVYTAMYEHI